MSCGQLFPQLNFTRNRTVAERLIICITNDKIDITDPFLVHIFHSISTSATDTDHLDNGRRFLVQIKIYKSVDHGIIRLFVYSSSLKSVPIFRLSHPFVSGTSLTPRWLRSKRSTRRLDSRFCFLARSSSCF